MPRASKPLPLDPPRRSPRRRAAPAVETTQSRLGAFLGALAITPLSPFPRSPAAREHDPWRVAVLVGTLVSVTLASIALYSSTHIPLWRTERAPLSHLGAQTHKPSDSVTYEELNEILSQLRPRHAPHHNHRHLPALEHHQSRSRLPRKEYAAGEYVRMLENLKPRARHAKKSEGGEEVAQMLENLHPRARHHNRYTRSESVRSKAEMLENLQPRARHNEARIRHAEARGRGEMLENLQPRARHAGVKVGSLETSERTVGEGRMEENESREQVSDALESEVTEQLEAAHDAAEDLLSVAKELVEELEAELEMIDEVREELEEVEVEKPVVGGKEKKVDEAKAAIKAADAKQVENTKPVAPQKESSSNPDKPVLAEKTNLAAEKLPTPESPKLRLRGGMGKNKYSQMLENLPRRQVGGKEEL